MKKKLLSLSFIIVSTGFGWAQSPDLDAWIINWDGTKASGYEEEGGGGPGGGTPTYTYREYDELADVQKVCFSNDSIWISSTGMTTDMGVFTNPGGPSNQNYVYRIPRNPVEATVKEEVQSVFTIGVLVNGIPLFGKGDGNSWDGAENSGMGDGIWNGDAMYSEGMTLDTAFGAHPQQQGAYHTHGSPYRLYDFPASEHSPIIGFGNDGVPIYGPFGYDDPNDMGSTVRRMESGYELRSITKRVSLPDGTMLPPGQHGPDVSVDHPLGEYSEDYEFTDAGDLDEYNGRWTKTPEYPDGVYAYFVTVTDENEAYYPYFIGNYYYADPESNNGTFDLETAGYTDCVEELVASVESGVLNDFVKVYPNPATDYISSSYAGEVVIRDINGIEVISGVVSENGMIDISSLEKGLYIFSLTATEGTATKKIEVIK